ncbi:hypothetical protein Bca101_078190 [Brassica carinata]
MPGSRGEITVDDQNGVDNDHKRRKKKKEGGDGTETENQLVMPSISKPRKRFIDKFRKRPKSQNQSSSSSSSRESRPCLNPPTSSPAAMYGGGQQISRSIRCTNLRRPILPRFTGAFRRVSGLRRRPSSGPDSYLLHRRLRRPRPKILSATSKKTENQGFKMDGLVVAHILFWLRGSGKFTLLGLSVSYLSGTESSDGQFGKYSQDDVDALRALADDSGVVDFLFTNEWPVGVTNRAAESDIPTEVSDSSCCDSNVSELVKEVKPRYPIAGSMGGVLCP